MAEIVKIVSVEYVFCGNFVLFADDFYGMALLTKYLFAKERKKMETIERALHTKVVENLRPGKAVLY